MAATSKVVCAWCETVLDELPMERFGTARWFGVCRSCAGGPAQRLFPTAGLSDFSEEEYDRLPFGLLEVDREAHVRSYNQAEADLSGLQRDAVLGKHFFTEVAPCTRVQGFEGVFRDLVTRGAGGRAAFDFVFKFAGGDRFVHIAMCHDPASDTVFILVQVAQETEEIPST